MRDHRTAGGGKRRWPCCLTCSPLCVACEDEATIVRVAGVVVGSFCGACWGELRWGAVPRLRPKVPRRPRGARLRDLQDASR